MAVAKIFINDFPRQLIKATVTREGNRAIDQAKFILCPETPVCVTDEVVYIQDVANLDRNNLIYNFCEHIKDESGYQHHPLGHTDFPSALSHWDFQCTTADTGTLQNTATERPLDMCMCCAPTPSIYIAGKVKCNNDISDRAIIFACMRYLTISNECTYDLRQDQKWSMSAWVYPTTAATDAMIMGKRVGLDATDAGYSLNLNMCGGNISFEISNGTCEWVVSSAMCSVPLCMWTNVTAVFNGQSNQDGMKIYINGDLDATGAACAITTPMINCADFSIAATACTTDHYSGRLDGVYFFAREINECEAASLFHEGGLCYVCGLWNGKAVEFDGCKGHLVIQDNAPADPQPDNLKLQLKFECNITDSSKSNCCITMGTGCETYTCGLIDNKAFNIASCRYICIGNNSDLCIDSTNNFSWNFWAKLPSGCVISTCEMLLGKRASLTAACKGWAVRTGPIGGPFIGWDVSNGCAEFGLQLMCTSLFDDNWHMFTGIYNSNDNQIDMSLYIDGIRKTIASTPCITGCFLNCESMTIGASSGGGCEFNSAIIDCVRIYKDKALTCSEVIGLYEATFGKFNTKYCIVTWVKAGSNVCDRTIFNKASSASTGVELKIEQSGTAGPGFTCSGFTASGFSTTVGCLGGGVSWRHNTTTIKSACVDVDDCEWHQIRVRRDGCNLITMYVDNVLQAQTATDTTDPTCEIELDFARTVLGGLPFDGKISSFRWYSGNLDSDDTCALFTCRNPRSNIKFGGEITKSQKLISKDELVAQSFGKELGEVEVRAQQFCNRTPEFILETIIKDNTNLDTHFHGSPAGITLVSYQADGKIVDIANDLSQLTGKVYHTDGLRQFHLHDASFTITTAEFDHFINMRNFETGRDDTEIVNCLLIVGENKRFTTSCTFTMCTPDPVDGCNKVFSLSQSPVTARVFNPAACCTEICPDTDCGYGVNTATKKLTFVSAPACGNTVLIEYEFELPLNIQGKNQDSIDDIGIKSKRLILPWITTRQDGVRFINAYLENFKNVTFRTEAEIPGLANGINENDVVTIKNDIKGIDGSFIIKSIQWEYPAGKTIMQLGEFNFQMLEFAKQITEKIHDLESAVVRVKDLRVYENPQETLALIATANVNVTEEFTETLVIPDVVESQLMEPAE